MPATTIVREKEFKLDHTVREGAPCEWSRVRGATHTLVCENDTHGAGTRPAKLLKTVLYVGVDEVDNMIVWEKWKIKHRFSY